MKLKRIVGERFHGGDQTVVHTKCCVQRSCRDFGNSANPGNFLAVFKLLSTYDPVIANHFTYVRQNPRCVSYLSHDIQNKFITLLATAVRGKILNEIQEAKYFGILFDSIPDISHTEQLSEIIRYMRLDYEAGQMEVR